MENVDFSPSVLASARRIRTHIEWNVETHIARARGPTSAATRSFISPAALLVKVIARISPGWAPRCASRCAIRYVRTRVLPEPAPATMSSGAPACSTAARCAGLSSSSSLSASTASRTERDRRGSGASATGSSIWLLLISEQAYDRGPTVLPLATPSSFTHCRRAGGPAKVFHVQPTRRFFYGYRSSVSSVV